MDGWINYFMQGGALAILAYLAYWATQSAPREAREILSEAREILSAFRDELGTERQRADNQVAAERTRCDQQLADERKRSDQLIQDERLRSDQKFKMLSKEFKEAIEDQTNALKEER